VSFLGRIMAGINAFISYRPEALAPYDGRDFGSRGDRVSRYLLYRSYYDNTAYANINRSAAAHIAQERLFVGTRGIYNPVSRSVNLFSGYIYGGQIDYTTLRSGAIPLQFDNDALLEPLKWVLMWSRFGEQRYAYAQHVVNYGDAFLKVVDDTEREKVRLEALNPTWVKSVTWSPVGDVKAITIEYERTDDPDDPKSRAYVYREVITKDTFSTFKDEKPHAYTEDGLTEWANPYGFVPVVHAAFAPSGVNFWGVNSYHSSVGKVDAINSLASLLNTQVAKTVNPILKGVNTAGKDIKITQDDRNSVPVINLPSGTDLIPLETKLSLGDARLQLQDMLIEIERDMPELALQRIRERGALTAPGVRAGYSDAIQRIEMAAGAIDDGLVRALQMALSIMAYRENPKARGLSALGYERGDFDITPKRREIIGETLTKTERTTILMGLNNTTPAIKRLVMRELEFSDDDIAQVLRSQSTAQQNPVNGAQQAPQQEQPQTRIPPNALALAQRDLNAPEDDADV